MSADGPGNDPRDPRAGDLPGGGEEEVHGARLRAVLRAEAARMDPTDPLDGALSRIQARTDAEGDAPNRRWLAPLIAAASVVALVAAGAVIWPHLDAPAAVATTGPRPSTAPPTTSPPAPTPTASTPVGQPALVPVYFGGTYGGRTMLYREFHRTTAAPLTGALVAMLAGPADPSYTSLWPRGTSLVSLARDGSAVTVTLSAAPLLAAPPAGTDGASSVQQVVYTVTATDPTVSSVTIDWPGGRAAALTRAAGIHVLASVWVLAPTQGADVRSPVTVSGTASVFEATVSWQVDRPDGTVVARGTAMTPIAAPARGPWSFTVSLPPGTYLVLAYAVSAKDGSHTWPDSKTFTVR